VTSGLQFFPAPLQAFALVMNPRLGSRQKLTTKLTHGQPNTMEVKFAWLEALVISMEA